MTDQKVKSRHALKKQMFQYQDGNFDATNFCAAPFIHMYVHSNEEQRVCCISTETDTHVTDDTELDLEKRWQNDYYKEFRKKFLRNEKPEACSKCYKLEAVGGISDRIRFNETYMETLEPNVETGNQYGTPLDLDIRPGNLCNLKCRMCGPVSSSQFQKEIKENKLLQTFLGNGIVITTDVLDSEKNIEFLLQNADKGERIKFLGGEPTIMPEVDKFLDILIEREYFNVPLHFTTNCTNNNKRFIDKLSKFNRVTFNYSIDGVGPTVEYIRAPVKFETINNTVQSYHSLSQRELSEISFTYQAYNFFNLDNTIAWAKDLGIRVRPEILRVPEWASIRSLPYSIRQPYLVSMIDKYQKENIEWCNRLVLPVLYNLINDDTEYDINPFIENTKRFDTVRNQHIKDYLPQIYSIIKDDYDNLQL